MRAVLTTLAITTIAILCIVGCNAHNAEKKRHLEMSVNPLASDSNPLKKLQMQNRIASAATQIKAFQQSMTARAFEKQAANRQDSVCTTSDASDVIVSALQNCATASSLFSTVPTDLADGNRIFNEFCAGACIDFINTMDAKFVPCFPVSQQNFFFYAPFMCSKDANGNNCGGVLANMANMGCEGARTQAACTGSVCAWDVTTGSCQTYVTNTILKTVCSDCIPTFLKKYGATGGVIGAEGLAGVQILESTVCAKVSGEFCYPKIMSYVAKLETISTDVTTMTALCADTITQMCLKKILVASMGPSRMMMDKMFQSCAAYAYNNTPGFDIVGCKNSYSMGIAELNSIPQALSTICMKNAAGDFCMTKISSMDTCTAYAIGGSCTTDPTTGDACDAKVKTFVDGMGCCLGTLQHITQPYPQLPNDQFPPHQAAAGAPTRAPQTPAPTVVSLAPSPAVTLTGNDQKIATDNTAGLFNGLGACPSVAPVLQGILQTRCGLPVPDGVTAGPVEKKMPVRIPFSKVNSDPVLKKRITDSLVRDVASNTGAAESEIKNPTLTEDTATKVTTAAAGRRMRSLATENGCLFTFTIDSVDPAVTDLASKEFDAKATSGDMLMTATTATATTECTGCLPADGSLGFNPESPAPAGGNTTSAGAVSVIVAVALVIMMLF